MIGLIETVERVTKMSDEEFEKWLNGWESSDPITWMNLKRACLRMWANEPDFRSFVEAMIAQDRPEEVLCWVASNG